MRKIFLVSGSVFLSAAAATLAGACSSSSSGGGGGSTDAGNEATVTMTDDGGRDSGTRAPGTLSNGVVVGMTADDYAVVLDAKHSSLFAVSATDLTQMSEALCPGTDGLYLVQDKSVVCTQSSQGAPGPTFMWSKAKGFVLVGQMSTTAGAAVSPDGNWVALFRNIAGSGATATADVFVVGSDGMNPSALATGVTMSTTTISWATTFAVVTTASASDAGSTNDAGLPTSIVSSYDSANMWAKADVASDAIGVATARAGSKVAVIASDGSLFTYDAKGGPPTTIDSAATHVDILSDGKTVVYGIPDGLKKCDVGGGTPQYLIAMGVNDLGVAVATGPATRQMGLSADGNTLMFVTGTGGSAQLAITTANVGNTANLLSSSKVTPDTQWHQEVVGDLFTADSSYALYNAPLMGGGTTIYAAPAAGGASVPVDMGKASDSKWAMKGTTIAYIGGGNLRTFDVKAGGTPKDVVTSGTILPSFWLTSAKDKAVYSSGTGPTDKTAITYVAALQ
jgi:hypothetical protein